MKDGSDNIDINDIAKRVIDNSETKTDIANTNAKILDELEPCFKDDDGEMNLNNKGHVLINKNKLEDMAEKLSSSDKEKYSELVKDLPPQMKKITDDTAQFTFCTSICSENRS